MHNPVFHKHYAWVMIVQMNRLLFHVFAVWLLQCPNFLKFLPQRPFECHIKYSRALITHPSVESTDVFSSDENARHTRTPDHFTQFSSDRVALWPRIVNSHVLVWSSCYVQIFDGLLARGRCFPCTRIRYQFWYPKRDRKKKVEDSKITFWSNA